jgi:hypothetical protein
MLTSVPESSLEDENSAASFIGRTPSPMGVLIAQSHFHGNFADMALMFCGQSNAGA